ncbi:relaxase/mobilization nuclease domain-containing protein [Brevundimonas nasdae]|uniref:MobA/VirD2-like nuclease domain-containing protein n=1 Tax=Brevundimonas nasdae TaxID=172043 RepID=A0ABX8TJS2_9CAUL|nr:hypothetical protein [Brevundimonas nasdae]QYC11468.1 hypothetical protein KWG56_05695 [Brevundimonas nasdae]QYC14256.1 hypothetical protein KWG63_01030 [Brevundimonas nasdae]
MSAFADVRGFEEALRPPIDVRRARLTPGVLRVVREGRSSLRDQVRRVVRRTPEVMVKITGRTRDAAHLRAHLVYISRNGKLALEGGEGERLADPRRARELADAWASDAEAAPRRRRDAPLSLSIVLSMPAGTSAWRLEDAARAFATDVFGGRFDYVFALHDEGRHPHVHLSVQALGRDGVRLDPRKADLQVWREGFAMALRARGIEAEATPRRARGVTRKAERMPVRKLRERSMAGGPAPRLIVEATREATAGSKTPAPWRAALVDRQRQIRRALLGEAMALSVDAANPDPRLAREVEGFVRSLPGVETQADLIRRGLERRRDGPEAER